MTKEEISQVRELLNLVLNDENKSCLILLTDYELESLLNTFSESSEQIVMAFVELSIAIRKSAIQKRLAEPMPIQ